MADSSTNSEATPASKVDRATPSTSYFSAVEEQIEQSKAHWSTLADYSSDSDEDKVNFAVSNEQEFQALQRHSTWGGFFANFTGDGKSTGYHYGDCGDLVMGKKFAEGAQAELYEAHIKWNDPRNVELDQRLLREYVLKVFKEGTLLKQLKSQMPQGLLQFHFESQEKLLPQYTSPIYFGILLKDGRFAFLMRKLDFDLRTLIECKMESRRHEDCGPFSKEEAELIMYGVALGLDWLHDCDIIHRDLKASNVLVYGSGPVVKNWDCIVADYECSIGVVGTNFFRAPEILYACKERKANERPEVFSKAADVYSYGMTCYEILTGKLPFEDHPLSDAPSLLVDLVINQHLRPEVLEYVDDWVCELLDGCWQFDPTVRPRIGDILNALTTNSANVREFEVLMEICMVKIIEDSTTLKF